MRARCALSSISLPASTSSPQPSTITQRLAARPSCAASRSTTRSGITLTACSSISPPARANCPTSFSTRAGQPGSDRKRGIGMKRVHLVPLLLFTSAWAAARAQNDPPAPEQSRYSTRYALAVIDDATFYGNSKEPLPKVLNQLLLEPTFSLKYRSRWNFSTSLIENEVTYADTAARFRVKETYAGLSAGDFDFLAGRKMVRWGTGY